MKLIDIIIIGIMICCVTVVVQVYYNQMEKECIRNPLVYGARVYENKFNHTFAGQGSFIDVIGNSPVFYFNSENLTIKYP